MPSGRLEIVVLVPDPVVLMPPGFRIRVQVPEDGNPDNETLPVVTLQVGWAMDPITGAGGVTGCALITTLADDSDIHPETETVNVYVPAIRPEIVVLAPVPDVVIPPGERVNVQVPVTGKPFNTTLPVATEHAG